jgi:F-type H+-transporting ATPase subunit epsilon
MPAFFTFEVHTPYRPFFSASVEAVFLSLTDGEIGVYANHSAFTAPVETGILRILDAKGGRREAFITEGILEVKSHKTVLMVDTAEWPDEIDYDRALASRQQARESLGTGMLRFETENAEAALKRAEVRIKIVERKKEAAK